jgi:hypothetical protein
MRRFLGHLGHPDAVLAAIEAVEGGATAIELVAEHENQVSGHAGSVPAGTSRTASVSMMDGVHHQQFDEADTAACG